MADLCSHPTEDVDPLDEEFYAACKLISECRTTLDEHLPNLKCESIRTDGGVQWRSGGLVDEVFLTSAQLKKHLVYAETQKERGNDDFEVQPTWIMMAQKSQGDETFAFAATAIDSEHAVPAGWGH
ncbi:hypothetical protein CYMTET_41104 [Cymbomonas tetramitiformis]|uniref:Uncharacterized protein n=1 Tax=Cymbomonas tetramitiformis TaxID=36881 RepID=A0AAE0C8S3_9CHLO|nr:hypothetical protein CYMTET_41104 [Cymbomonas tetramitiformis]